MSLFFISHIWGLYANGLYSVNKFRFCNTNQLIGIKTTKPNLIFFFRFNTFDFLCWYSVSNFSKTKFLCSHCKSKLTFQIIFLQSQGVFFCLDLIYVRGFIVSLNCLLSDLDCLKFFLFWLGLKKEGHVLLFMVCYFRLCEIGTFIFSYKFSN